MAPPPEIRYTLQRIKNSSFKDGGLGQTWISYTGPTLEIDVQNLGLAKAHQLYTLFGFVFVSFTSHQQVAPQLQFMIANASSHIIIINQLRVTAAAFRDHKILTMKFTEIRSFPKSQRTANFSTKTFYFLVLNSSIQP